MKIWNVASWAALSTALAFACSSKIGDGDSETHWIACNTTSDCPDALVCESRRCVPALRDSGTTTQMVTPSPETEPLIPGPAPGLLAPDTGPPGPITPIDEPDAISPPENPEGDAGADVKPGPVVRQCPENPPSARVGDPDPSSWIQDCESGLSREYFRIYQSPLATDDTVEIRPGISPFIISLLVLPCTDASHELRPLLDRYDICTKSVSSIHESTGMKREDAVRVVRYLHSKLVFVAAMGDLMHPFPLTTDLLELCAFESMPSPRWQELCERARQQTETLADFTQPILLRDLANGPALSLGDWLASRLNDLHGARCPEGRTPSFTCLVPGNDCGISFYAACLKPCTSHSDCEGVAEGPKCGGPGVCGQM